jgi:hypothetical protein
LLHVNASVVRWAYARAMAGTRLTRL